MSVHKEIHDLSNGLTVTVGALSVVVMFGHFELL